MQIETKVNMQVNITKLPQVVVGSSQWWKNKNLDDESPGARVAAT